MENRKRFVTVIFCLVIALSLMACFGISQVTQSIPTPSPTSLQNPTGTPFQNPTETPLPAASETPIPATPTLASTEIQPIAGQVNIIEINGFTDEADYWYFYGLARNDTDQPIHDLQIEIKLMDATGNEIYTYTTYSVLTYLAPGEISPFLDFTTEPFQNGSAMQASVAGFTSLDSINRAKLEFRGVTLWADEYNDIYLAGEVFNGNSDPVEINAIGGSLADENGNLVTTSYAYPFLDYLEPNTAGPFVMMFDAPLGQAEALSAYTLYPDGLITNPTSTYDLTLSENLANYRDLNDNFHLVGAITNNTTEPMNIYLVAGAYDDNGFCLDANSILLPVALNPGELFPFDFTLWGAMDYVPDAQESATKYMVFIDWISTYEASSAALILSTKDDTHSLSNGIATFTGTVLNDSGQDLTNAIVLASMYDMTSGELLATGYSYVPEPMEANATGAYNVEVNTPPGIDIEKTEIVIRAIGQ